MEKTHMTEAKRTHQIKHWATGSVLLECDIPDGIESGLMVRHALEQATAKGADLTGADLKGADLTGAYLKGADLTGAYLKGAYLTGADLTGAYLKGAYLTGADLTGADLTGADLKGADLKGADLTGAYLKGAYLTGADLTGADLKGAYLKGAYLTGAYLTGADLTGADLKGAYLTGADLTGADLTGADGEPLRATPEQSIENLDKVRAIILDDSERLQMGHWHGDDEWVDRTCAEETLCGTTHCLAGWLQVCSTKPEIRSGMSTELAGILSAPVAAKLFYSDSAAVLSWLEKREYAIELGMPSASDGGAS